MTTPRIKRVLTLGTAQINVMTDRSVRYVIGPGHSLNHLYSAPMDKVADFNKLLAHYGLKLGRPCSLNRSPWCADTLVIDLENFQGMVNLMLRKMSERTRVGWVDHSPLSYDRSRAADKVFKVVARLSRASTG